MEVRGTGVDEIIQEAHMQRKGWGQTPGVESQSENENEGQAGRGTSECC